MSGDGVCIQQGVWLVVELGRGRGLEPKFERGLSRSRIPNPAGPEAKIPSGEWVFRPGLKGVNVEAEGPGFPLNDVSS